VGENKSKGKYAGKHEGERKKSENEERELFVVQPLNKVVNDGLPERNL
jgi:hypothetical protein